MAPEAMHWRNNSQFQSLALLGPPPAAKFSIGILCNNKSAKENVSNDTEKKGAMMTPINNNNKRRTSGKV